MTTVPRTLDERIQFYETRLPEWAASPAAIGLEPGQIQALGDAIAAARDAQAEAERARVAAVSATAALNQAVKHLHSGPGLGSDLIETIRRPAAATEDQEVLNLAHLPPVRPRRSSSAVPPPGTPSRFATDLLPAGPIRLRWRCETPEGPSGTVVGVARKVGFEGSPGETPWVRLGTVGRKEFIDTTLPAGLDPLSGGTISYAVTATRSTRRGTTAVHTMQIGSVRGAVESTKPSLKVADGQGTSAERSANAAAAGSRDERAA